MKKSSIFASVFIGAFLVLQPLAATASESANTQASAKAFGLPDFVSLVEENNQVVVNISTTKEVSSVKNPHIMNGMPEEMLRYFFGIPQSKLDEFKNRQEQEQKGNQPKIKQPLSLGSGFIISEDGYILTNHHVIDGADEIIVRMRDRKELVAEVIGSDERTDVALIKIKAKGLPVAKIGTHKSLKVGQWVLAIGEPFGLDYTVTHGIVSALGRSLPEDTYVPFIQTDVAVNPGNSGGPLFNLDGEVVGINSQIYSSNGGSVGLSFSIPIDIAMNVATQIKAHGEVVRGYLGIVVQEVTSDLSKSFGLERPMGALVGETFPDTPAEKAGIEAGDIILEFDGKVIEKSADLPPIVGMTSLDKKVKVKLLRQGKVEWIKVKLAALDKNEQVASLKNKPSNNGRLGIEAQELDEATLRDLKLPFGVGVKTVLDGPAARAGIRAGDIIVTIDFKPVKSIRGLRELVKSLPKDRSLAVRVIRGGRSLFLPLMLEK